MRLTDKETEIIRKIREVNNTESVDTIVSIKLVKVGRDYLPVIYKSTPVSKLGIQQELYDLLESMQKGLDSKKPALFTIEYEPEGSVLVRKASLIS